MKRVKETLAVLFLSLVLGSCGSLMDNNILLSIHKGMTQEEVTKLLGRPTIAGSTNKESNGNTGKEEE